MKSVSGCIFRGSTAHLRNEKQILRGRRAGIQRRKAHFIVISSAEVSYNQFDYRRRRNLDGSSSVNYIDSAMWVTQGARKGEAVH